VIPRLQCAYRSIPTCPQSCRREKDTRRKNCIAVAARRRALASHLQIVRGLFCCKILCKYICMFVFL
jgi:hypothetical protein